MYYTNNVVQTDQGYLCNEGNDIREQVTMMVSERTRMCKKYDKNTQVVEERPEAQEIGTIDDS